MVLAIIEYFPWTTAITNICPPSVDFLVRLPSCYPRALLSLALVPDSLIYTPLVLLLCTVAQNLWGPPLVCMGVDGPESVEDGRWRCVVSFVRDALVQGVLRCAATQ